MIAPLPKNAETILPNSLYVVWECSDINEDWKVIEFFEWVSSDIKGNDIEVQSFLRCEGPLGMGELRHSFWGEEGYIFYPNMKRIVAALQWLKDKGYDLE